MSSGLIDIQRSLLPGYRRALAALGEERRRGQRFDAVVSTAILGWWVGGESRIRPAQVVNISRGGVLLLALEVPREMERANFSLSSDRASRWVPGTAVGNALDTSGRYLLRFKFDAPCPDGVFALALGLSEAAEPREDRGLDPVETPSAPLLTSEDFEIDLSDIALECPCPETSEFACFDVNAYEKQVNVTGSSAAGIR